EALLLTLPAPHPDHPSKRHQRAEEQERTRLRHGGGNVYRPGEATSAARLRCPAEYVGGEEVPAVIQGFQPSKRRIGDRKLEIMEVCYNGIPIAVSLRRALDRSGPIPGAVGLSPGGGVEHIRQTSQRTGNVRSIMRGGHARDGIGCYGVEQKQFHSPRPRL